MNFILPILYIPQLHKAIETLRLTGAIFLLYNSKSNMSNDANSH